MTSLDETSALFDTRVPLISGAQLKLPISIGKPLFIVGPNGVGKSSLMLKLYTSNPGRAMRVAAHRQTWMESNAVPFSPQQKIETETNARSWDAQQNARWLIVNPSYRTGLLIARLIDLDNSLSRRIRVAAQENNDMLVKKLAVELPPLEIINELFASAGLPIKMTINDNSAITASKNGGTPFSIAALSDGERAALIIAGEVLTADKNSLILLDEPERHLHASIVVPLLLQLFAKRPDCSFVISTHELGLPLEATSARVAMVRDCSNASSPERWDIDVLDPGTDIDESTKAAVLGARRKILFIEGDINSLDKPLYQIIFPNVSVVPRRTCTDVKHAVKSIQDANSMTWVKAYGIVDADQLCPQRKAFLEQKNVFALSVYSVEGLYYSSALIGAVATRQADLLGLDKHVMIASAMQNVLAAVGSEIERLAARMSEQIVKDQVSLGMLDWKRIKEGQNVAISVDAQSFFLAEKTKLSSLLEAGNVDAIMIRYPVRETNALEKIAAALQFKSRVHYESAVRKLLRDDGALRQTLLSYFGSLPGLIN